MAASEGNTDIIEYMTSKYNISINAEVKDGKTMLDIAHDVGRFDVMQFLLHKSGGEKFKVEKILLLSLHQMSMYEKKKSQLLLKEALFLINSNETVVNQEVTYNGLNLLQYAASKGSLEIVKALLERNLVQVLLPLDKGSQPFGNSVAPNQNFSFCVPPNQSCIPFTYPQIKILPIF